MFCIKCGTELQELDRFCYKCGAQVIKKSEQSSAVIEQNPVSSAVFQQPQPANVITVDPRALPEVKTTKMCGYAVTGFVLSFFLVFGSIPALIFSLLSLKRIKREGYSGKALATIGLCVSGLTLFITIILLLSSLYSDISASSGGGAV